MRRLLLSCYRCRIVGAGCCYFLIMLLLLCSAATASYLPAVAATATEIDDLDKPISFKEVSGIAHGKVRLPCSLKSEYDDVAKLVLWYKEPSNDPIYGFDMRNGRHRDNATRWSSPKALGHRAYFSANDLKDVYLDVSELKPKDEGLYRCRVDFANSPTTNQKINLTVIELSSQPIILDGDTRMPVSDVEKSYNEGSDVKLICVARGGKPPPRLTWYLENNVIDDSYEYKPDLGQTLNHLSYPRIGRHHYNSQFVCQSNNIPPDSHFNVDPPVAILSLIVNLKPLDVHILTKESRVLADKKYEVECRSSGSRPAAVITWWIANRRIDNQTKTYAPENNQSLSILSFVPSIDDDGKYLTCRAENPNITDSALEDKWHLDVQYQPVVSLRMGSSLNPNGIKEGDDVYFECLVRANPEAYKLSWFKDGNELKNNSTAGIVLSDRSLVLQGISRNSAGNYTCRAVNSEGKTMSNPVPLRVMYAPVCMEGKNEVVVGALKQETVSLICSVESHPAPQSFHWTFNNSGDLIEVPHSRYSHTTIPTAQSHSQPHQQQQHLQQPQQQVATELKEYQQFHGSRMNYTPSTEMDYGTVACWASNQVGRQRSPCLFQVIAAGRPYALHNCTATELSSAMELEELGLSKNSVNAPATGTGLLVRCLEGYDGGLPIQAYHVEVVSDEDGPLILNKSVPATPGGPMIEVAGLSTGRSYRLFLYAVNAKGRSEPAILEPVTLKGVAMYTTGDANASVLSPLLLGLAATATLLALAVAGILAALYRKHASDQAGSPKHAPIVCEPPNPDGSTTPVHPQTKQPVDDIDPDIIPNEYERRPLTYAPVYKTPPQRRRIRERNGGAASPVDDECDKKDLQEEALLADHSPAPTIRFAQNHHQQLPPQLPHHLIAQATSPTSLYGNSPTLADFKQMAFEAYNQRNNQNVYYSLQRPNKGILTMPQRPVTSSVSAHGKIHQPEVVTRSNRIQESCI